MEGCVPKSIDLTGQVFGMLKVIRRTGRPEGAKSLNAFWLCECECGKEVPVPSDRLRRKRNPQKSCGCVKLGIKSKDLVGKKFGLLTVLDRADAPDGQRVTYWLCRCDCGEKASVSREYLEEDRKSTSPNCGCQRPRHLSTGDVAGKLTVLAVILATPDSPKKVLCLCDCGWWCVSKEYAVRTGRTKSCGCLHADAAPKNLPRGTHLQSNTPTYISWGSMKQRCLNENHDAYPRYGGRGIKICER